jgi:hypothetical protein
VIYPNPCDGTQPAKIRTGFTLPSNVKVQVFTTAFRKVQEQDHSQVPVGADLTVDLSDKWGTPLASGVYYVVLQTSSGRSVVKLMVLR